MRLSAGFIIIRIFVCHLFIYCITQQLEDSEK